MRFQGKAALLAILLWGSFQGRTQDVAHTATPTVIRSETRLVLVDAVVTDKKGNYVPDLTQKSFKVFEDNKEQPITSFAYEADPNSPNNNQKHYLVLFFDNASTSAGDQMQARSAAQKFVDNNTGPNKYIAVVNFSGTLRITQNFTNDADRLREVISGVKTSTVNTNEGGTGTSIGGQATLSATAAYGISSVLLGLRGLAKGLADVPGRKMLVMLTAGFPSNNSQVHSELLATIDACNKSNVSVYPIDVRGLVAPSPGAMPGRGRGGRQPLAGLFSPAALGLGSSGLNLASFGNSFQARGGAAPPSGGGAAPPSGGTSSGAGAGAGRGGTTAPPSTGTSTGGGARGGTTAVPTNAGRGGGANPINPTLTNNNNRNPLNTRMIIPPITSGVDANQNALYMLAEGTGGFVIINTNDLLGGMEKIAREQDQYYLIGFTPAESAEGTCHTLHVKVDHGDSVRSRSGYCNVRQVDVLAGKPAENELEALAAGQSAGNLGAPLQLPFFYASPNVARVNLAMEIPSKGFKFDKVKGKLHAEMNIMGVAYREDKSVGAKFSDTLKFDFENKVQVEEFAQKPVHYESQFDVASGKYNFKVVFNAGGENFGKVEKPLTIEPFDGKQFALSGLVLSKEVHKTDVDLGMDQVLIEDKVPLVSQGNQIIPAADYHFDAGQPAFMYLEVYDQSLTDEKPPDVGFAIRIVDKAGQEKLNTGNMPAKQFIRPGNPVVPLALILPVKELPPGGYRVEVTGLDAAGKRAVRSADFDVEAPKATALGWDKK